MDSKPLRVWDNVPEQIGKKNVLPHIHRNNNKKIRSNYPFESA